MPNVTAVRFADLTPGELACWDAWQRSRPELDSPFFRPEFTAVAATASEHVEVAVLRDGGETLALLPLERVRPRIAWPVLGAMNDFHGLIARPEVAIDMPALLQGCGLVAADFHGVPTGQRDLVQRNWKQHAMRYMDLAQGFPAYCQARKQLHSETVEKTRRKARRLAQEHRLRFELRAAEPGPSLATLLAWKNRQQANLGVVTPLQSPRTAALLARMLAQKSPHFEAFVSVLWADDRPAAIAYSLRSGATAHCWFIGYERRFAVRSPGLVLLLQMAEALAGDGVQRLHLGKGDERFKTSLASDRVLVAEGIAGDASLARLCLQAWILAKGCIKRSPLAAGVRLLRPVRLWLTYGHSSFARGDAPEV
jgi:CelD/BcsL family acetyltransferase involved in cellulose biosynthesis